MPPRWRVNWKKKKKKEKKKVTANLFFELMIIDIRDNFCKTPSVDRFEQREMVDKFWNGQKS